MGFFKDFKDDFSQAVNELMPGEDNLEDGAANEDLVVNTLENEVDVESELSKLDGLLEQVTSQTAKQQTSVQNQPVPSAPQPKPAGETKIELLEPTCPESTIAKFIENKGAGVHHVAFAVEDGVANALAEAESKEIRLIDKAPRKGAEGLNIAFLHPKSTLGVLTELCEH